MRTVKRVFVAPIIAVALLAGPAAGSAMAKPPSSAARGSCAVNPNPVSVGATWTLTGSNLGAGKHLTVGISDAGGTTYFFKQADAGGGVSLAWHSYYSGTSSVRITDSSGRKPVVVASCSFQVV